MIGSGGCALVMKKMGEGKEEEARKDFSLIVAFAFGVSIIITIISLIFISQIINFLGSTDILYEYCKDYLFFMIIFVTPTILKFIFEQFLVAVNRPNLALALSFSGGILNIILDYVFIVVFDFGVKGAAIATGVGYAIPAFLGLIFFFSKKNILYYEKPSTDFKVILKSCYNGSSEMISQLSSGIITFLFNVAMLKHIGVDGVASITIVLYIQFLIVSVFLGYCIGISPKISFYYGENNSNALKKIISTSFKLILGISIIIYIIIFIISPSLIKFFTQEGTNVYYITIKGIKIYSISFLFVGFNIFISGMFTAFSNGKISAIISFLKTLIFESFFIIIFSNIGGVIGIWLAVPTAQIFGVLICRHYYNKYKNIYKY